MKFPQILNNETPLITLLLSLSFDEKLVQKKKVSMKNETLSKNSTNIGIVIDLYYVVTEKT